MRRYIAIVIALFAALALAGCGPVTSELQKQGYHSVSTSEDNRGNLAVSVAPMQAEDAQERLAAIAKTVWQTNEGPITALTVNGYPVNLPQNTSINGTGAYSRTFDHAQLESAFGPRPEGLDDAGLSVGTILILVFGGLLVLAAAITVIIVLLVRSSKRRKAALHGRYPHQTSPHPGFPPPPPGAFQPGQAPGAYGPPWTSGPPEAPPQDTAPPR